MPEKKSRYRRTGKPVGRPDGSATTLTPAHQVFVAEISKGKPAKEAARIAGFTGKNAGVALLRRVGIQAELTKQRTLIRAATAYDAKAAMEELDSSLAFARETGNANALAKLVELRMKLHGLLIERVDQRQVGNFSINISGIDDPVPSPIVVASEPVADKAKDFYDE